MPQRLNLSRIGCELSTHGQSQRGSLMHSRASSVGFHWGFPSEQAIGGVQVFCLNCRIGRSTTTRRAMIALEDIGIGAPDTVYGLG